ncbi:alanine--tRNA ligase [Haploplasma axanthum]|nr:alanine--tRNA ligase [Haploplasma axanthum]
MRYMTSNEIRETWLRFFKNKGHHILESASLIPNDDPTLLWINAGVAPLKKYFDGSQTPISRRLTNVQKCIRTNDIDNVGRTARHHTFFEMLGNFSIGDYFKKEAIEFGFEILTSNEYFGFPIEKLIFTYYPEDLETKEKWISLGVPSEHVIPREDNFWEIGEGPCGPDTEIYFDRGEAYDKRGLELVREDLENDRYIEIWNIVFSQFNSKAGLERHDYPELPNKNIDTGAGLERFACVIQGTETNFETDLFFPIIKKVQELTGVKYESQMAFKVIADHIKTLVFSISDGAMLSNEGRGYVLRRILRRAVKYGRNLGLNEPFLHKLIDSVIETMGDFYPKIKENRSICERIILKEEQKFLETIAEGEKHLQDVIKKDGKIISGESAFMLYDTYGFPIELTIEYAEENNVTVDTDGFYKAMQEQKVRSREARENIDSMATQSEAYLNFTVESKFIGYNTLDAKTEVIAVFDEGIVLKETPFYATSGGQVSDFGTINDIEVIQVKKLPHGQHLHVIDGNFNVGDIVDARVNENVRHQTEKNHSATHLLHKALKEVFGTHVVQQGSLVNKDYLRFDFNHFENITDEDLLKIEKIVNDKINKNAEVVIKEMKIADAKKLGAMALFGEKYGDVVRVVKMNDSIELCGGTHVKNTEDIKKFAIVNFESIGSGIFRITASTDFNIEPLIKDATNYIVEEVKQLNEKGLTALKDFKKYDLNIKTNSYSDILDARMSLKDIRNSFHELEKQKQENETKDILTNADKFIPENVSKKTIIETKNLDIKVLKQLVDVIYDKINAETVLLVNITDDKATFIAKTNGKTNAGSLIKELAKLVNGSGGGKDNLAQGGTKELELVPSALEKIKEKL